MSIVFYGFRAKDEADLQRIVKSAKRYTLNWITDGIEFQVFNTSEGIVFRILESGYGLKNKFWKNSRMKKLNYDDRSDIPSAWNKNLSVVLEIDELLKSEKYRILNIKESVA